MKKLAKYEIEAIAHDVQSKMKTIATEKSEEYQAKILDYSVAKMMKLPAVKTVLALLEDKKLVGASFHGDVFGINTSISVNTKEQLEKAISNAFLSRWNTTQGSVPRYDEIERKVILLSLKTDNPDSIINIIMGEFKTQFN